MPKFWETFRDKSIEVILAGASGLLLFLVGIIVNSFGGPFLEKVLPEIPAQTLLAVIGILLLLLALAVTGILILRSRSSSRIDLREYAFDKRLGLYKHKTNGLFFCVSCMSNNRVSPLLEREDGWLCMVKSCEQFYHNPDYQPEPGIEQRINNPRRPWDDF